jgi:hypothetical protein
MDSHSSDKGSPSQQAKIGGSVVDDEDKGSVDVNEGVGVNDVEEAVPSLLVPSLPEFEGTVDDNVVEGLVDNTATDGVPHVPPSNNWCLKGVEGLGIPMRNFLP